MKKNTLVKILTVLVILAICLISFVGIFVKDKHQMRNILPEYILSMNLTGARNVKLVVDDSTKEVIYDSEGKIATDGENEDGSLKEGYTKKEEKINSDEVLNSQNYILSKKIIEKRLKASGVEDYILKQNSENGEIILELPENINTDETIHNLTFLGKFEIKDSDTNEILLDNGNIKETKAVYRAVNSGTAVYLSIEFDKEGKSKLEEITKTYISSTDEEGKNTTKKVTINLDDEKLLETFFGEKITSGILQLSIGNPSNDNEQISAYIKQASQIAGLIDTNKMPVKYTIDSNNYLSTTLSTENLKLVYLTIIIIAVIGLIYLCIKYKKNGILLSLSYIGYVALVLLVIRYTNVIISLETIASVIILLVMNYIFIKYILNKVQDEQLELKEITKQAYTRFAGIVLPLLIMAVVFTFTRWLPIASIGMTMFWGLIIMFIYNYIIINTLLKK